RELSRALPPRRSEQADAVAAAVWRRRLQLPASGPLWRARFPAAGDLPAVAAGRELHRRRIRADGAAPAHAVTGGDRDAAAGRGRDFPRAPSSGAGHARHLSRQYAPRREPPAVRPSPHARDHLSRRQVNGRATRTSARDVTLAVMMNAAVSTIETPLARVRGEIAQACAEARRDPASVTLVAISKTFGAEAIEPVIAQGQRVFGENRVQEAKAKWPALEARHPGIELHLVGSLQSNKAKDAVALFDAIHSVDRQSLAEALAREI